MGTPGQNRNREEAIQQHRRIAAPIVAELNAAGFAVESLDDLRRSGRPYPEAVPILLAWLPRIDAVDVKESLVRTLSVPWAKGLATRVLLNEFSKTPKEEEMLRWAIGNAIEVIADGSIAEDLHRIVSDPENGTARQMFVLALAKAKHPANVAVLLPLLNHDDVAGQAAIALGKLAGPEAIEALERLASHARPWIRTEAKRAIARIAKRHTPQL